MTPEQQKEELSKAYIAAVAARCGYALGTWSQDQGGLDITIGASSVVGSGHLAAPKIDLQLKCTADLRRVKERHVSWQFDTAAKHDRLVCPRSIPMLLVVMILPKNPEKWLVHSVDKLVMRRCAFYKKMTHLPKATVARPTVQVPFENLFSPQALQQLMEQVSKGELP